MTEFLVELYLSRACAARLQPDRLRSSACELSTEGTPVRFVRSIFVPADETCFVLYEAASAEAAAAAAHRAGLPYERIAETA